MQLLLDNDLEALVGGAYAMAHYTGIARDTKDFDLLLRPADVETALVSGEEPVTRRILNLLIGLRRCGREERALMSFFAPGTAWDRSTRPGSGRLEKPTSLECGCG